MNLCSLISEILSEEEEEEEPRVVAARVEPKEEAS